MDRFNNFRRMDVNARPLRMRRGKHPYLSLPFVGKGEAGYWSVPASGGYFGGYKTGEAMAHAFFKVVRDDSATHSNTYLAAVVEAFMCRFEQEGGASVSRSARASNANDGMPALRGQWVGFFNTVMHWASIGVKRYGGGLDAVSMQALVDDANAGLGFDMAAFMKMLHSEHEGD